MKNSPRSKRPVTHLKPLILATVIAPAALWLTPRASAAIVLDGSQNPYNLNPGVGFTEGLLEGTLPGGFNETDPNPGNGAVGTVGGTGIVDRPRLGECRDEATPGPQWLANTTYIYSGQFFDADGTFTFGENVDDNVLVKIDGVQVLRDQGWDTPTRSNNGGVNNGNSYGMGPAADGWHDIEIRMGNGGGTGGNAGNSGNANGWGPFAQDSPEDIAFENIGFGLNAAGTTSVAGGDYVIPIEPAGGGATVFRVVSNAEEDVEVRENNAVNLTFTNQGLVLSSLSFTTNNNKTLTINDAAGKTLRSRVTHFNAGVSTIQINGAADVVEFLGTNDGSGGLTKTGPGLLRVAGPTTFSGGLNVAGGPLELTGATALGGNSVALTNGSTLRLNIPAADTLTAAGTISGVGDLVVNSGTSNLNGAVSVTNLIANGGNLTTAALVTTTANVTVNGGATATFAGGLNVPALVSNGGAINITGGTNTIQTIQESSGSVNISASVTNAGGTTIGSGRTLSFNPAGAINFNGAISTDGGKVQAQSGVTDLGTKAITFVPLGRREGLLEGYVDGSNNASDGVNLGQNGVKDRPRMGETARKEGDAPTTHDFWANNQTWIYTGQFFDTDGKFAFAESIDDQTRVIVDGVEVLRNDRWDVPTSTGNTEGGDGDGNPVEEINANPVAKTDNTNFGMGPAGDGWHDVEFRFNNGGGGAGTFTTFGWGNGDNDTYSNKGFGVNREPGDVVPTTNEGSAYEIPIEPIDGTATVFRTTSGGGTIEVGSAAELRAGSTTGGTELLYSGSGGTFRLNDAAAATADSILKVTVTGTTNTLNTGANHTLTSTDLVVGAGGQLVKTGAGRFILTGSITGDVGGGTIDVNGGSFFFNNGSIVNPNAVTTNVKTGALVGGTGKLPGPLNVASGGTIAPGASPGVLSSNTVTFSSGSTFSIELVTPANSDRLDVTGGIALGNATLFADILPNANFAINDLFFIMTNDAADTVAGTFAGLADNSVVTIDGIDFRISYDANSATNAFDGGNDVALMALMPVPEPGSLVALASGIGMLVGLQRFRRRQS